MQKESKKPKICLFYKTKISKANTNSNSLRTIIPKEIVNILKIKENDYLKWEVLYCGEKSEIVIIVKKEEH